MHHPTFKAAGTARRIAAPLPSARATPWVALLATLLGACASPSTPEAPPKPTVARPGSPALACEALAQAFQHPGTRLTSVEAVAAGSVTLPGITEPMPAHCRVLGKMHERTGPLDGKPYAIGFEMRLPSAWNGRFFYQANGGLDGLVTPAWGDLLGGGPRSNGVQRGFAVLSSDAGHALDRSTPIGGGSFGLDPQARLDYGYNAVAQLTPMARALIARYYGRAPDTAYLVGTSNGGRHGLVAAARDTGRYDGIVAVTPGWRLPLAGVAQLWGAQQFAAVSQTDPKTQRPDLQTALTPTELALVADAVLARCDALDGLRDGLIADTAACQRQFDAARDVPACEAAGSVAGRCVPGAKIAALARVMGGPKTRDGRPFYAALPWDNGLRAEDWRNWKFVYSVSNRDAVALAYVMSTPPASPSVVSGLGNTLIDYALGFDVDRDGPKVYATSGPYSTSVWDFMSPPEPYELTSFLGHGGKLLLAHGTSDPVFSALDTVAWYEAFKARHGARAEQSARLYLVPGMNHSRGGPATDQFDLVSAMVAWVEQGVAPQALTAAARGPGSNLPNKDVPADWSPSRTRLLCPYPQVARYSGSGDAEKAESFRCTP